MYGCILYPSSFVIVMASNQTIPLNTNAVGYGDPLQNQQALDTRPYPISGSIYSMGGRYGFALNASLNAKEALLISTGIVIVFVVVVFLWEGREPEPRYEPPPPKRTYIKHKKPEGEAETLVQ